MGTQTNHCNVSGAVWGGGQQAAPTPRFTRGPDEREREKKHSYNNAVCFLYKPRQVFPAGECCVVLSLTFLLCVLFVHIGFLNIKEKIKCKKIGCSSTKQKRLTTKSTEK